MFAWNIYTVSDSSRFTLTVPMHYAALFVLSLGVLIVMALTIKSGHAVRNILIFAAVILFYGFLTYSVRLDLDRSKGTATLSEFQYFHWKSRSFPLSEVDNVFVRTGSTTSQLALQFSNGSTQSISFLDQNGGKEEAAFAANHFLRTNPNK